MDRTKISWNGWGWAAHKDDVAANEAAWSWLAEELGMPSLLATPSRALDDIALAPPRLDLSERAHFAQVLGEAARAPVLRGLGLRFALGHDTDRAFDACVHPTAPSSDTSSSFFASTANSIGNSLNTCLQKPSTIIDTASSSPMPRLRQ